MAGSEVEKNLQDPVTAHMRTDFVQLEMSKSVEEALRLLRQQPPEGRIIYFYVVDEANRLQGVVPTRRLLLNEPETSVGEIMLKGVIAIPHETTVLDACEFFTVHRLLAFPVVDQENRLIGVIDVELYTEELQDLDERRDKDDLFQLIGVHLTEVQQASSWSSFLHRFPWLLTNIGGGILAAFISALFQSELQKVVTLALFIPVVLAIAESVSIQSVSLALQVWHGKSLTLSMISKKLRVELFTGLFLGLASGITVSSIAFLWLGQVELFLSILVGIAGGVTFAALIGTAIPHLLHLLKREPQVAAGPIALASTDVATLLFYFGFAHWLLVTD